MSARLDLISPATVGEDRIVVTLTDADRRPTANISFAVELDYSACLPSGASPPIEVVFQGPDTSIRERRIFRVLPSTVVLTPRAGGPHLILVKELHHNEWQGRLVVDVVGDSLTTGARR